MPDSSCVGGENIKVPGGKSILGELFPSTNILGDRCPSPVTSRSPRAAPAKKTRCSNDHHVTAANSPPQKNVDPAITRLHPLLHHQASRDWLCPQLHPSQLVLPLFVTDSYGPDYDIPGFAPNKQWSCGRNRDFDTLVSYLKKLQPLGLATVMLFGVAKDANSVTAEAGRETADERGSSADCEDCAVVLALRALRKGLPDLQLMADVCLCAATSHGHCGLLRDDPAASAERLIDNDATLLRLTDLALTEARAGAHWVCPSDMMDGRVDAIRRGLDKNGFTHVGILSYTSKKASCMYGPFRAAVDSKFKEGNRKRYQHPPGSSQIANLALTRDLNEGASAVVVKPSLFYTDTIRTFKDAGAPLIAAYVVSGEYKMLSDYGKSCGCLPDVLMEAHQSLLRAGADILITYFTPLLLALHAAKYTTTTTGTGSIVGAWMDGDAVVAEATVDA